ncbi:MAG: CDP-alcohol phosphatidyltransferase family protein [Pseudomonadota bacterium]
MQPNQAPNAQRALYRRDVRPPFTGFALSALTGGFAVVVLSMGLFSVDEQAVLGIAAGLCFYLVAAGTASFALLRTYPHATLGLCNIVTLVRLVIVATLVGALLSSAGPSWAVFSLAAIALLLDGVDGWLARRQALASSFGARFDVEVDAAFALVLALHAVFGNSAGLAVVLLGLPYYLFKAASLAFPWLNQPLPERFTRKAICVIQIAVLVALQLPLVAIGALDPLVIVVALALAWSFVHDIRWLWRARS